MTTTSNAQDPTPNTSVFVNEAAVTKKKDKNGKITFKENPAWIFPMQPKDFDDRYPGVRWGSSEHDHMGKKLFKNKASIVHSEQFSQYFPRYMYVKKSRKSMEPYSRRRVSAFERRGGGKEGKEKVKTEEETEEEVPKE